MAATASGTSSLRIWLMAARIRTLPAAVAPVLVGTSLAIAGGIFRVGPFIAALLGSILIQIGTNLANDYSDARRGAELYATKGQCFTCHAIGGKGGAFGPDLSDVGRKRKRLERRFRDAISDRF